MKLDNSFIAKAKAVSLAGEIDNVRQGRGRA